MQDRGRFIVLDGVDGCGKSTQAAALTSALETRSGAPVLHVREPGSTTLGEALRGLLLERGSELSPAVEALLLVSARRQLLDERIGPALARGEHVVCERFHPSTYAYQAIAGGLPEDEVLALLTTWAGAPAPDLVVLLDLAPERAARRVGAPSDRIEDKGTEFQARVAEGYRRYAARMERVSVVDAHGDVAEVAARVLAEVRHVL